MDLRLRRPVAFKCTMDRGSTVAFRPWVAVCAQCGAAPYWWLGPTKSEVIRDLRKKGWHVVSRRGPFTCPDCVATAPSGATASGKGERDGK